MSMSHDQTPSRPVRVVLANDSELVLRGLRSILAPFEDQVQIVGTAVGEPEIQQANGMDTDVMLVDAFARDAGGLSAAATICATNPPFAVAVFTEAEDERLVLQALRVGVTGYLLKSRPAEHLVKSLQDLARGEIVIDGNLATKAAMLAARSMHLEPWPGAHLGLTRRESEVLLLLAAGAGTDEISSTLDRSRETVRSHLKGIFRKLGVSDRAAAVAVAWREGVVPSGDEEQEQFQAQGQGGTGQGRGTSAVTGEGVADTMGGSESGVSGDEPTNVR